MAQTDTPTIPLRSRMCICVRKMNELQFVFRRQSVAMPSQITYHPQFSKFRSSPMFPQQWLRCFGHGYTPVALLVAFSICIGDWHVAVAQRPSNWETEIEQCANVGASEIQDELNRITQTIMAQLLAGAGIEGSIPRHWEDVGVDATIAAAVSGAIADLKKDTNWWDRFSSGWSEEKATEFTTRIANEAFSSESVRIALEEMGRRTATDLVAGLTRLPWNRRPQPSDVCAPICRRMTTSTR